MLHFYECVCVCVSVYSRWICIHFIHTITHSVCIKVDIRIHSTPHHHWAPTHTYGNHTDKRMRMFRLVSCVKCSALLIIHMYMNLSHWLHFSFSLCVSHLFLFDSMFVFLFVRLFVNMVLLLFHRLFEILLWEYSTRWTPLDPASLWTVSSLNTHTLHIL